MTVCRHSFARSQHRNKRPPAVITSEVYNNARLQVCKSVQLNVTRTSASQSDDNTRTGALIRSRPVRAHHQHHQNACLHTCTDIPTTSAYLWAGSCACSSLDESAAFPGDDCFTARAQSAPAAGAPLAGTSGGWCTLSYSSSTKDSTSVGCVNSDTVRIQLHCCLATHQLSERPVQNICDCSNG